MSGQRLWWKHGVIYQIYPRSFQDSNGDGVGDLPGILARVPYLSDVLGVEAIWLSPFYPSPMKDFGYDVADYTGVDPVFGTLADFDRLVTALHARGLKIIIDFVPNHSSSLHPWFVESRSSGHNRKRDWYVWRDAKPDGSPPNNWLSVFGGPAWEWDEGTGQYYLHSFLPEQPDLNWRNPEVEEAMLHVLRFWLERGVDGFRVDVAHFIMKDPELRDNPPAPVGDDSNYKSMGGYDSQLHVYDMAHPDVHQEFRRIRAVLDEYSREHPRMMVGEIHVFDWPQWATYYGTTMDEFHLPFNFGLLRAPWEASAIRTVVDSVEGALPTGAWPNWVMGNHDEHRIATRLGREGARLAMLLLLTLRGTPTTYYGDEIAMTDVPIGPDQARDPWGLRVQDLGLGRDPERSPMQWNAGPNAGFCPAGAQPWLPIAADYGTYNVASEQGEETSMLSFARALLALRASSDALSQGSYRPIDAVPADCYVYERRAEGEGMLVLLNFASEERSVSVPGLRGTVAASTACDRQGEQVQDRMILRADEGCVVRLDEAG